METLVPETILGWDDWLIFGRTQDGTLVYTITETDWHWLDAPHHADCWDPATGRNCNGDTKFICRIDSAWMLARVTEHRADYDWQRCGHDTDGTYLGWPESGDAVFTEASRKNYLPEEQET